MSCDILTSPPPPDRENPVDPSNPNFQPPLASISAGPSDNSTVLDSTVTVRWQGNLGDSVIRFSYQLDGSAWSSADTAKQVTLTYLDEGVHVFNVRAQYVTGAQQATPSTRTFTVDAINGPALRLFPRKAALVAVSSQTLETQIYAEEISGTGFAGAKIVLSYDVTVFQTDSSAIQVYGDPASFLAKNGGSLISFKDVDKVNGVVTLSLAVAGGNPENVTGTGLVARITFQKLTSQPRVTRINISAASNLRTSDNQTENLNVLVGQVVEVR